jgi:hypothetical protein
MTPEPLPPHVVAFDPFTDELLRAAGEAADGPHARLHELVTALRAPAQPAELHGAEAVAAQMAEVITAHPPRKESSRMSRIPRVATIAAVAVLGFGGVAAAATGTNPLSPLLGEGLPVGSTTTSTSSTTTTNVPTSTTTTVITSAAPIVCPADVVNHGDAVSQVAQDPSTTGAEHGQAVSEMAKSDCGKPESASDGDAGASASALHSGKDKPKSNETGPSKHDDGDNGDELGS